MNVDVESVIAEDQKLGDSQATGVADDMPIEIF